MHGKCREACSSLIKRLFICFPIWPWNRHENKWKKTKTHPHQEITHTPIMNLTATLFTTILAAVAIASSEKKESCKGKEVERLRLYRPRSLYSSSSSSGSTTTDDESHYHGRRHGRRNRFRGIYDEVDRVDPITEVTENRRFRFNRRKASQKSEAPVAPISFSPIVKPDVVVVELVEGDVIDADQEFPVAQNEELKKAFVHEMRRVAKSAGQIAVHDLSTQN